MERYEYARRRGIQNRKLGDRSATQDRAQDRMAAAAEQWAAERIGARDIHHGVGVDPGFDLIIDRTGQIVDVKWTSSIPGKRYGAAGVGYPTLNLATWKGKSLADLYVLVIGESEADFDVYAWADGYATQGELLAAPIVQGRYGRPYHALGFDLLRPLEQLR